MKALLQCNDLVSLANRYRSHLRGLLIFLLIIGGTASLTDSFGQRLPLFPPNLTLTVNPTSATTGQTVTGTISTNYTGTYNLSSDHSDLISMPASVTVTANSSSMPYTATFSITVQPTAIDTPVVLTATWATASYLHASATLQVQSPNSPPLRSLTLPTHTIPSGASTTGTITLSAPAYSTGSYVFLTSSAPSQIQAPALVIIPAGATTATFAITTSGSTTNTPCNLTASVRGSSANVHLLAQYTPPFDLPPLI